MNFIKVNTCTSVTADEDLELVALTFFSPVKTVDADFDLDPSIISSYRAIWNYEDSKGQNLCKQNPGIFTLTW